MSRTLAVISLGLFGFSTTAVAAPTTATLADFSTDAILVDFEDIVTGEPVDNQYAVDGVVFSAGMFGTTSYYTQFDKSYGNIAACNFYNYASYPDITVEFSSPTTAAGFYIITNDADDTNLEVYTLSGGSLSYTGSVFFDTQVWGGATFVGVQDPAGFDALVIDVEDNLNNAFCMDDFYFEAELDSDGDGIADGEDNCPDDANADQADSDFDGAGDVCDPDDDDDGVLDKDDNCVFFYNPDQSDFDGDGEGDECDGDADGDGVGNDDDLCPESSLDSLTNDAGCTGAQFIELSCDADDFSNHGGFVSCVADAANQAADEGLIGQNEKGRFVKDAARSK
jgi:hypothetical protein